MFDDISSHYDFLNHLLSFQIDKIWRRKTSRIVASCQPSAILDVATGTADLAIRMAKDIPEANVIGVDLSEKMLEIGRKKIEQEQLDQRIKLMKADAVDLPFEDDCFDAVTVAFGVRNFEHLEAGLQEMLRALKHNGLIAVLEFSHPKNGIVKGPYRYYSKHILPKVGRMFSKHAKAYSYLPSSIEAFPESGDFVQLLNRLGVDEVKQEIFCGGIATLYYGAIQKKPANLQ